MTIRTHHGGASSHIFRFGTWMIPYLSYLTIFDDVPHQPIWTWTETVRGRPGRLSMIDMINPSSAATEDRNGRPGRPIPKETKLRTAQMGIEAPSIDNLRLYQSGKLPSFK